jgi:hypothetical protein
MTKNSPTALGAKIIIMAIALCGVFYIMSQLHPGSTTDPLAVLFGTDIGRPLNWCPPDVKRLQVEAQPQEVVTDPTQIQSYCQILTESFDSSKFDMKSFKPILKAFGTSDNALVVEADTTGKLFRFQGLPFGSKQLSRQLDKKIQP